MFPYIAITGVTANALLPFHSYSPVNRINVQLDNLYIIVFTISLRKYINSNILFILKNVLEKVYTVMHLLHHKYKIKQ